MNNAKDYFNRSVSQLINRNIKIEYSSGICYIYNSNYKLIGKWNAMDGLSREYTSYGFGLNDLDLNTKKQIVKECADLYANRPMPKITRNTSDKEVTFIVLKEIGNTGMSSNNICKNLGCFDRYSRTTIRNKLRELRKSGVLEYKYQKWYKTKTGRKAA